MEIIYFFPIQGQKSILYNLTISLGKKTVKVQEEINFNSALSVKISQLSQVAKL